MTKIANGVYVEKDFDGKWCVWHRHTQAGLTLLAVFATFAEALAAHGGAL